MENRVHNILTNLASTKKDLLALSDDIWLDIDHNDSDTLRKGIEFKEAYNMSLQHFTEVASELSRLIQNFTQKSRVSNKLTVANPTKQNHGEQVIQELGIWIPHSLSEDFRYKRPYGFTLERKPYLHLTTWQQIYEAVCKHLAKKDLPRFLAVRDNPIFVSKQNKKYFSRKPGEVRDAREFVSEVFAEVNLSSNQIRDNLKKLLDHFDIPQNHFVAYFRGSCDVVERHKPS